MLIKCPECNEKISNSAIICPKCGVNVKSTIKRNKYINKLSNTISDPEKPKKPKFINKKLHLILKIIASIVLVFSILIIYFKYLDFKFIIISAILFLMSVFIFIYVSYDKYKKIDEYTLYKKQLKEYNIFIKDPKLYKFKKAEQIYNKTYNKKYITKCPYCNSIDVKKITTSNRVISTITFGIASNKIGKQWYCNKCKSSF